MHPVKALRERHRTHEASRARLGTLWTARESCGNTLFVVFEPLTNLVVTLFCSHARGNSIGPERANGQADTV